MTKKLIALSDGHGTGTAGKRTPTLPNGQKSETGKTYMNENLFNRAVVKYLDAELKRNGFNTLLVAPTDADTPLENRTKLANDKKADLYVSIHANANNGKFGSWGGIETYYHRLSKEGYKLATAIHMETIKGTPLANRGIKDGSHLWEIRKTNMPAVLWEGGFMDSHKDFKYLLSEAYRKESAIEICKGICRYYGVTYKAEEKAPAKSSSKSSSKDPLLSKGDKGVSVRDAQTLLNAKGAQLDMDGAFGDATETAVLKFQRENKLEVDGYIGPKTWAALRKPAPKAKSKKHTVKKGETFYSIAKKYDMNVKDLMEYNSRVKPDELAEGDVIHLVPAK